MSPARWTVASVLAIVAAASAGARASELSARSLAAYERYVRATEARMDRAREQGALLWVDAQPSRANLLAKLQRGEVVTKPLETEEDGRPLEVPDAFLLHSVGAIFLPGATRAGTLAVLQDYDRHADWYAPGVRRSHVVEHTGDDFLVSSQIFRKLIRSFVFDIDFAIHYGYPSPTRVDCRAIATRAVEVVDAGKPTEHERPVEGDPSRVWRFRAYVRLEERDGGTYMEAESLVIGPEPPFLVRWLVGPLVRGMAADMESEVLTGTRAVLGGSRAR